MGRSCRRFLIRVQTRFARTRRRRFVSDRLPLSTHRLPLRNYVFPTERPQVSKGSAAGERLGPFLLLRANGIQFVTPKNYVLAASYDQHVSGTPLPVRAA